MLDEEWAREWLNDLPYKGKWNPTVYTSRDDSPIGWAYPKTQPLERPTPSNHRSTLVFDSEVPDMHRAGMALLPPLLGGNDYIHEFSYGKSGPTRYSTDLVVVEIHVPQLRRRLAIADPTPLTSKTNRIYGYWDIYRRGRFSRADFVDNGKYVESTSKTVWNWLDDHGWIATNRTGYGTVVPYPSWTTVHAIELKQRKYAKAKDQVLRSAEGDGGSDIAGYADYMWVALDAGTLEPAIESGEFGTRPESVGLIALDRGGAIVLEEADYTHFIGNDVPITRDRIWLEETILDQIDPERYIEEWEPQEAVTETEAESNLSVSLTAFADGGDDE